MNRMHDALCPSREVALSRRAFLHRTGLGIGGLALGTLFADEVKAASGAEGLTTPRKAPLAARATRVIHIFASGAPSHLDTFDPKPALERYRGQTVGGATGVVFPSPYKFVPSGKSGLEISELFPSLSRLADELCVIRSMKTDIPAHPVAQKFMNTGSTQLVKPCLGSWVLYGLGTENQNLPGFVTLGGNPEWRQSAFLPSPFQGTRADFAPGRPVDKVLLNLKNEFTSAQAQRLQLDLARQLNAGHSAQLQHDEQLEARIESFELAFRMQREATDAFDVNKEPLSVRQRYGTTDLGGKLLCARRLIERGVRFVQVEHGGWDHHQQLAQNLSRKAGEMDQPVAALIADLKERGLLDSTLVIWGGEFGRTATTPGSINDQSGRDHHARCFSTFLAGGGVKGGMHYGATDELGVEIAEKPVHVHDFHATILRLLGFDHTKLTYRYNGRDFRLTDNYGSIVHEILA